eukprot:gene13275-28107_t
MLPKLLNIVLAIIFVPSVCSRQSSLNSSPQRFLFQSDKMNSSDVNIIATSLPTRVPLFPTANYFEDSCVKAWKDLETQSKFLLEKVDEAFNWLTESLSFGSTPKSSESTDFDFDVMLGTANSYLDMISSNESWDFMAEKDGVKMWRTHKPLVDDRESARWPCTKACTLIDAPARTLENILLDSSRIRELNRYSAGREDVITLGPCTKIVWNRVKAPISYKPHDFCSVMHVHRSSDGTVMVITKGVEHPLVPRNREHVRSEIIFGLNVLRPVLNDPSKTEFTAISHVKYSSLHPYIVSKGALQGTVNFIRSLKSAVGDRSQ